ncbi:MAG: hypothetical protein HDR88_02685 [Bacteroides sp.]|nr:hypothetical protein [Bacteroides sp.]
MKHRLIILFCSLLAVMSVMADSETDKTISKILRDTNTYISADVRAATEDAAYQQAMAELTDKITAYMKEKGMDMPDAIYLSNISNHSERLISQSGANRCRVLVYVKKKDLLPITDTNSAILEKNSNEGYTLVQPAASTGATASAQSSSATASTANNTLSPVLARLAKATTQKDVQTLLVEMKKRNAILNAAAFPIANINDFYVVVIDKSDTQVAILHCVAGEWTNAITGEKANLNAYKYCTAYWLTLP